MNRPTDTGQPGNNRLAAPAARVSLALLLALIGSLIAMQLSRPDAGALWLAISMVAMIPLVAGVPGLMKQKIYTAKWLSLVVIPYIAVGVTETIANPQQRLLPALVTGAGFALFVGLVFAIRTARARHNLANER